MSEKSSEEWRLLSFTVSLRNRNKERKEEVFQGKTDDEISLNYLFYYSWFLNSKLRLWSFSDIPWATEPEEEEWDRTSERTPIPSPYYSLRIREWNINETLQWRGNQMKDELADRRGHSFNPSSKSKRKQDKMILNSQWLFTFHWRTLL